MSERLLKDDESARLIPVTPHGATVRLRRQSEPQKLNVSDLDPVQADLFRRALAAALNDISLEIEIDKMAGGASAIDIVNDTAF